MRVKEVAVGRADVRLRRRVRTAAQDLLVDEPLVVVFIKLGFEPRVGNVIRSCPLPNVANHLLTAIAVLPFGKSANGRGRPEAVLEQIRL